MTEVQPSSAQRHQADRGIRILLGKELACSFWHGSSSQQQRSTRFEKYDSLLPSLPVFHAEVQLTPVVSILNYTFFTTTVYSF